MRIRLKDIIFSILILISAAPSYAADRSVNFPSSKILVKEGKKPDKKPACEFRIVNVSASSEKTALSCEVLFRKRTKGHCFIERDCHLYYRTADSVATTGLTAAEGIPLGTEEEMSSLKETVYKAGDKLEFTLYFGALPEDVSSFDFIESLSGDWTRVDISLVDGAASREEQRTGTCPYDEVIKYPTFLGQNRNSFSKWVNARLHYPEDLRLAGKEGLVKLKIDIDADGNADYQIIEYSLLAFNAEALRVVADAPKWAPATVRGKPAECSLIFPVIFKLQTEIIRSSSLP